MSHVAMRRECILFQHLPAPPPVFVLAGSPPASRQTEIINPIYGDPRGAQVSDEHNSLFSEKPEHHDGMLEESNEQRECYNITLP